ncbi:MAG: hypothetical protein A3F16_07985 [Deltaproteobacteria bacterium RIFCSPHIGHO2_12_FULL_43_9]|nr:MAG: hypothetical protein A3F16_07985 [Deltaproteobacteria bacterium RIFCSPHIGHO2_12_FULL_43_9]
MGSADLIIEFAGFIGSVKLLVEFIGSIVFMGCDGDSMSICALTADILCPKTIRKTDIIFITFLMMPFFKALSVKKCSLSDNLRHNFTQHIEEIKLE